MGTRMEPFWRLAALALGALALAACGQAASVAAPAALTAVEAASAVRCARGLTRIELVGGVEDGFAATGTEPSRIRPARLPNAYLDAVSKAQSGVLQLRDYDEAGQDKVLIDHFAVPRDIVSGAVIVRLRTTGGSDNDGFALGNLDAQDFSDSFGGTESYGANLKQEAADPDAARAGTVVMVPFESLTLNPRAKFKGTFLDFLNRQDRPDAVDFETNDDTIVDVAMLILCQKPQVERGTTFVEFRSKFGGADVSLLSCLLDKTQAPCNPFEGDQICTAALPVACYKPGGRAPPNLVTAGLGEGYSPGGEVRMTKPVAASGFAARADADTYCAAQFGPGWQILEYHVGSGGAIATYSDIAPKTRAWVDVSDQRYANCWDRNKSR